MNKTKGAILVLAGLNVALIYFCAVKSHESMMVSSLYRSSRALAVSLPRFVLPDADGRQFASEDILMVEEYTLFVLLSPSDCSPCLAEINFWTQLALSRQRLHVCAIARHGNIAELRQWIKNLDVRFPVLCDEGGGRDRSDGGSIHTLQGARGSPRPGSPKRRSLIRQTFSEGFCSPPGRHTRVPCDFLRINSL